MPAHRLLVKVGLGLPFPATMDGLSIREMRGRLPDGVPPYEMIAVNSLDGFLSTTAGIRSPFLDEVFPCECRYYEGTRRSLAAAQNGPSPPSCARPASRTKRGPLSHFRCDTGGGQSTGLWGVLELHQSNPLNRVQP